MKEANELVTPEVRITEKKEPKLRKGQDRSPLRKALGTLVRIAAGAGLAWLSAQSVQPSNSQIEASTPPDILKLLGHTPDTVPGYIGTLSIQSEIQAFQTGETITRVHPTTGQTLRWIVLHQEKDANGNSDPNPIVFQYFFDGFSEIEEQIAYGQEIASSFMGAPVIREFPTKFSILGRVDRNVEDQLCGRPYTDHPAKCLTEPFEREINKGTESGLLATESAVVIKGIGITGWADIQSNPNIIPPINDFMGLYWKLGHARDTAWRISLHEWMHNLGWDHPPVGSEEDKASIMGHGDRLLPQDEARLTAILTSNQNNPSARYVFPKPQVYSLRDGNIQRAGSLQQIQGLKELDTGILNINPEGVKQIYIRRVPALGDGAILEYYFGDQTIIHALGEIGLRHPEPVRGVSGQDTFGGMSYTWEVKISPLQTSLLNSNAPDKGWSDPRWNEFEIWPGKKILLPTQTLREMLPAPTSASISNASPEIMTTLTPTLKWNDVKTNQFYYEVQLTPCRNRYPNGEFIADPREALAALAWELNHGGETNNLYQVRKEYPLESGTEYCWRVRPRVQGDGTPVAWSETYKFKTPGSPVRPLIVHPEDVKAAAEAETQRRWESIRQNHWDGVMESIEERSAQLQPAA